MKACGVVVAMVQGHNWVPIPSKGLKVNVGTNPAIPTGCRSQRQSGQGGCKVGRSGWGGAEDS